MYEPKEPTLVVVKSRISSKSWGRRVDAARKSEAILASIDELVSGGASLNQAIRESLPPSRRSWAVHRYSAWKSRGLDALIDARLPREPHLVRACEAIVRTGLAVKPELSAEELVEVLRLQGVKELPSLSTLRTWKRRLRDRARYQQKKASRVEELTFAGGELLLAAELETNAVGALTDVVMTLGEEAKAASGDREPRRDVERRDRLGRFTAGYNRARKRKVGEAIPRYLAPAAQKAVGRVPSWPRFVHERRETVHKKLMTLTLSPAVSETKGWDALRAPQAAALAPLTGYAYMPSTLSKMTSALAISDAGPRLLLATGKNWESVAQSQWGEAGAMAAVYVDNHAKEVWTSQFMQSGRVSHLNRIMPCITTTYVHTGAGTPVVASVQSGSAPLAPRLVDLVEEAETKLGGEVNRAVIIDAEGSTFDILETFGKKGRVIVTPLRPSRMSQLNLSFSKGSYYRPYRDNDQLRVATGVLTHKSTGRSLTVGALLVRRPHRKKDTVLLTTGMDLGMQGRELADLYYRRWRIQENAFKEGTAIGLDEHRGNCGTMVQNVAVVTELERLASQVEKAQQAFNEMDHARPKLEAQLRTATQVHKRAQSALETRRRRLDARIAEGRSDGRMLGKAAVDHHAALTKAEDAQKVLADARQALERQEARKGTVTQQLAKHRAERDRLASRTMIRQLDVAQDSILTATKLTLALLLTFATREYLTPHSITPHTFISRIFGITGRREIYADEEHIIFYSNPRDPEINEALAAACQRLNTRNLNRSGRRLRYATDVLAKFEKSRGRGGSGDPAAR